MSPDTSYWAVACSVCGGMIALDFVRLDSDHKAVTPTPDKEPFLVNCIACGNQRPYGKSQVALWQGPRPAQDWGPHPAFRKLSGEAPKGLSLPAHHVRNRAIATKNAKQVKRKTAKRK
jgi:hypothetical protein